MQTLLTVMLMAMPEGGSPIPNLIFIAAIILIFYFFMIRPQTQKAKKLKAFREGIKKGEKIVTIGGIHGKVEEVRDTTLIITVEGGGRLKMEKSAVSMEFSGAQAPEGELAKN